MCAWVEVVHVEKDALAVRLCDIFHSCHIVAQDELEGACAVCLGNVIRLLKDAMATVAMILIFKRILGLDGRKTVVCIALQEKAGRDVFFFMGNRRLFCLSFFEAPFLPSF